MENEVPYDGSLYRGFYIFIHPEEYIAEIPRTFVEWFGNRVSCTPVFRDSSNNIFNIGLVKAMDGWAFTSGVQRLLRHYDLMRGSWVKVFYLGGSEFFVEPMNRDLFPVKDNRTWYRTFEFGWNHCEKENDPYVSNPDDDDWKDMATFDILICSSHLTKNKKSLPTHLVRDAILPMNPSSCVLRDQHRGRFYCEYQFCVHNDEHCTLKIGWLEFVNANDLKQRSIVRLGIRRGDPSVIHAKVIKVPVGGKFKIEKKSAMKDIREAAMDKKSDVMGVSSVAGADDVNLEAV